MISTCWNLIHLNPSVGGLLDFHISPWYSHKWTTTIHLTYFGHRLESQPQINIRLANHDSF